MFGHLCSVQQRELSVPRELRRSIRDEKPIKATTVRVPVLLIICSKLVLYTSHAGRSHQRFTLDMFQVLENGTNIFPRVTIKHRTIIWLF